TLVPARRRWTSVHGPGQHAVETVNRLLVVVMAVSRRRQPLSATDRQLECRGAVCDPGVLGFLRYPEPSGQPRAQLASAAASPRRHLGDQPCTFLGQLPQVRRSATVKNRWTHSSTPRAAYIDAAEAEFRSGRVH